MKMTENNLSSSDFSYEDVERFVDEAHQMRSRYIGDLVASMFKSLKTQVSEKVFGLHHGKTGVSH